MVRPQLAVRQRHELATRPSRTDSSGQRPYVLVNMAMTADGKIATSNRRLSSFSSARDRTQLYELRATADAVMTGARTVNSENLILGPGPAKYRRLRIRSGLAEYNLRVVVSGSGSVDPNAEIFKHRFSPILVVTASGIPRSRMEALQKVADEVKTCGRRQVDFGEVLQWLAQKWGVRRLLCEGGGALNSALFAADLVDELHLTVCPRIFGGRDAPTIADGAGVARLALARLFELRSPNRVGDELFVVFCRTNRVAKRTSAKR